MGRCRRLVPPDPRAGAPRRSKGILAELAGAFDNADDCIYVVDAGQRVVSWNRAGERLLGVSARDAVGRRCHELIAGRTAAGPWCRADCAAWRSARRGMRIHDFELLGATRDGQPRWVSVCILVLRSAGETLLLHVLRDISVQKRLERLVARVLAAFEAHGVLAAPGRKEAAAGRSPGEGCGYAPSRAGLTHRELDVLQLLSQGFSTRAIAERMALSPHTVRNHVRNALQASGLHTRAEAVSFAIRSGLL